VHVVLSCLFGCRESAAQLFIGHRGATRDALPPHRVCNSPCALRAPLQAVLVDTHTHPPPLPSTTLCVEHHLIDLSLYCVLCVRNDAPAVCLLVFLAGGYFYRETILEMKSSDPSRTGPRSKAKNRDGGGAGDATLLLFVSSACVRRVVVVYFLWLLSNGGRFGRRLMQLLLPLCGSLADDGLIRNQYLHIRPCHNLMFLFFEHLQGRHL